MLRPVPGEGAKHYAADFSGEVGEHKWKLEVMEGVPEAIKDQVGGRCAGANSAAQLRARRRRLLSIAANSAQHSTLLPAQHSTAASPAQQCITAALH